MFAGIDTFEIVMIEEEYIRLIFGLKMKQIRTEKDLSLYGLAKLTGLSKSYLNEIEKGKKYPKTDKIVAIAESLDVPYDNLVSLKLDKNLAPLGEILQSKILKEIPLDLFGIREADLIDIISNAPVKVNAFISTLIEIAQNYNLTRENFFLAALRSYQEANNNYFDEIEKKAEQFAQAYSIDNSKAVETEQLEEILVEEFAYNIVKDGLKGHEELRELRSIYIPSTKTLLLSSKMDKSQLAFIYAKEIGYNYMLITDRLYTFSWIKFESFDQVLNNFMASYFAGALLVPKQPLLSKLKSFFDNTKWDQVIFEQMISSFNASAETFYQRLTNILPHHFHFKNLFFLRFTKNVNEQKYNLSKELHITRQQAPHANEAFEHYCRRWISINLLNNPSKDKEITDVQISHYAESDQEYLVISSVAPDPFKDDCYRSVSIGMLMSTQLKSKVQFSEDAKIPRKHVGITCERCAIIDCKERACEPTVLVKQHENKRIEEVIDMLVSKYSASKGK